MIWVETEHLVDAAAAVGRGRLGQPARPPLLFDPDRLPKNAMPSWKGEIATPDPAGETGAPQRSGVPLTDVQGYPAHKQTHPRRTLL